MRNRCIRPLLRSSISKKLLRIVQLWFCLGILCSVSVSKHIAGCVNRESDALSRLQNFITSALCRPTTDADSGGLTTQQLDDHLNKLLHSAITKGSRKTYERAWTIYVDFASDVCDSRDSSSLLPVSVNSVALFIAYLSARKFAASTISAYVTALSYVHKLANIPDPTKNFLVQKFTG